MLTLLSRETKMWSSASSAVFLLRAKHEYILWNIVQNTKKTKSAFRILSEDIGAHFQQNVEPVSAAHETGVGRTWNRSWQNLELVLAAHGTDLSCIWNRCQQDMEPVSASYIWNRVWQHMEPVLAAQGTHLNSILNRFKQYMSRSWQQPVLAAYETGIGTSLSMI